MTDAPPPATRFQMRPCGFRTVSLSEAPVFSSISRTKRSSGYSVIPNGCGNSMSAPHFFAFRCAAVESTSAWMSSTTARPSSLNVNGFSSRSVMSRSSKTL
eukprot:Amastigsp_a508636_1247.p3 type:complete len:101 gc:universal Amastigsp_a508636_1247:440-742(+)